ncbi:hypothetical protein [Agrococcus sp. KRD186]|nr:hypothetical protein [Agrococcus sp. KRD186]
MAARISGTSFYRSEANGEAAAVAFDVLAHQEDAIVALQRVADRRARRL